ncbi:hypothetical protein DN824_20030 [Stutzerimonas nosocomialis]|uniref:Uncharacterized protein n=1 Tax=Stutzerimonas nosocomialis TaxID=1056496 RepID=A0A5R9R5E2_9GAMM|nr:hypothetical protein DN824_20030 [Stutzerimonas nosocomialis]TLX65275.1 hypothetical protein DN820_02910 [Stutzerimonas nosocomialis]
MMTPALLICAMIGGWLLVAAAMLWGMLRIARRHYPRETSERPVQRTSRRRSRTSQVPALSLNA